MNRPVRGMSLVDVIVAVAITGSVLLATSQVMLSSQHATSVAAIEAGLASQALETADRIANDLKNAAKNTVVRTVSSPTSVTRMVNGIPAIHLTGPLKGQVIVDTYNQESLSFNLIRGYAVSGLELSPTVTYSQVTDPVRNRQILRRTENGQILDLCDTLDRLTFTGSYGDSAQTSGVFDVWEIGVTVIRYNDDEDGVAAKIARNTKVQLRF